MSGPVPPDHGARHRVALTPPRPGTPAGPAVARLFDLYSPRLFALARRLCRHERDAEDLVQDVFLQAHRKWHTFKGESSPGTWLHAIAARACKARARRRGGIDRRMPALSQLMPWNEDSNLALAGMSDHRGSARGSSGPVHAAIQRESVKAVHEAILTLPEPFRLPLVFKEMLELPIEDVALALDLKPQTVKTRVHRARLLLRKAILRRPGLARARAKDPLYDRRVCLDLLKAKLDAMDREQSGSPRSGRRGFPIGQEIVCERCRSVFAELDLAQDACAQLSAGALPARVRSAILRAIAQADGAIKREPAAHRLTPRSRPARPSRAPRAVRATRRARPNPAPARR
ncbi:MAG: RNA polymerase sigma factor [Phycisphaerales bacterium]